MRVLIRLSISLGCIVFGLYGPVVDAYGQTYPAKSITVVVPFPAGGPSDVVARIVTEHMSRTLRQQMVIENVGGAGGTLGSASNKGDELSDASTAKLVRVQRGFACNGCSRTPG